MNWIDMSETSPPMPHPVDVENKRCKSYFVITDRGADIGVYLGRYGIKKRHAWTTKDLKQPIEVSHWAPLPM